MEFRKPIPLHSAIKLTMEHTPLLEVEEISLHDSYHRILAEPIIAKHNIPPFDRAPYDGFAIRSEDSAGASEQQRVTFQVVDHIGAGSVSSRTLGKGEAIRIMTGAAMPKQADAVVMLEQAKLSEAGDRFTIRKPFQQLENVSLKGEDAAAGKVLLEAGGLIHPGTIALLATLGYAKVKVARRPVVGIIATGSELLEIEEPLVDGKIRNSNEPMLQAQIARIGVPYRSYGKLKDQLDDCYNLIKQALSETDCLITTGGVSVGDYDYLPAIYEKLGAKVLFNKIAMRPGSVTTLAVLDGKLLFGLSGNPSACYTGFELFTRPALLKMMGANKPYLRHTQAKLSENFTKANPFMRFIRASITLAEGRARVAPAGFNKSNAVTSLAHADALIALPGGSRGFSEGDVVDVLLLGTEEGEREWNL